MRKVFAHQFKLMRFVHIHARFGVIPNNGVTFNADALRGTFDQRIQCELTGG
jgi:hypothetical protein